MSAHRLYCYAVHQAAVEAYLAGLGVVITPDVPHLIDNADQLRGLEHITFITIDNHPTPLPQAIWNAVLAEGALVIHVNTSKARETRRKLVAIRHYEPSPLGHES